MKIKQNNTYPFLLVWYNSMLSSFEVPQLNAPVGDVDSIFL